MATPAPPVPPVPDPLLDEQNANKRTGRKKFWFGLSIALLIAAMAGAGIALLMQTSGNTGDETEEVDEEDTAEAAPKRPPVFLALEPFVVNLRGEDSDNYLRLGLVLETSDEEALEIAKQQLPRIRNSILLLLSSKKPEELSSLEGKRRLAEEIIAEARKPMTLPEPTKGIEGVNFSDFVIQ